MYLENGGADRTVWDAANSPGIFDYFTEKVPEGVGALCYYANYYFWYWAIPGFR